MAKGINLMFLEHVRTLDLIDSLFVSRFRSLFYIMSVVNIGQAYNVMGILTLSFYFNFVFFC